MPFVSGRIVVTPDEPQPYKVVLRYGRQNIREQPVATIGDGERILAEAQGAKDKASQPYAPLWTEG